MKKPVSLGDRMPIWKIEKGLLVSRTQSVSCVMEVGMPEAYSVSENDLKGYYDLFNRMVKAIPRGHIIHKQDYYTRKNYQRDTGKKGLLASSYEKMFHERSFFNHRSYIFITKNAHYENFTSNLMTLLATGRLVKREIKLGVGEFMNTIRKVQHLVRGAGIEVRLLKDVEIKNLLGAYFNLGNRRILKDLLFEKDHIRIGDDDLVVYNSISPEIELPGELDSRTNVDEFFDRSFTYPLGIGFRVPHIVNTIIRKNDPAKLIHALGRKREKILSMSFKSRENEQLVKEYDSFLEEQVRLGQDPVHVTQNIMLWGKGDQLNIAENELNNALTKMDVFVQRNINCANVFWGCTPGNASDLPESEYQVQFSDAASMYFPIETNPKNSGIDGIKLSERDYGIPVTVDLWDKPFEKGMISNRNMFVLGPSGSGKSFFTNFMVRQLLEQGYHVTIIDVGGSYKRLCRYRKGKYFEFTATKKMSFNPFFVRPGEEKSFEEQENLKTLIFKLWKGEGRETTKEEYTILSKCIKCYYEDVAIDKRAVNFNSFFEYFRDEFMKTLTKEDASYFNFTSFELVFQSYYKGGEYDYLLNSDDEFSIADLPFCVFEVDEIKDHPVIFPVVTMMIMDVFLSKMRSKKEVKKIILIEEAWKAITSPEMAGFLKYLYKTVRKFNGAVGIITQEIEDIVGNAFVKNTILNNADIQILLDQSKYQNRFGEISKLLGLPDSEVKKVLSINKRPRAGERFKDAYIRLGIFGKVYSVLVSREEAAMFTTEASESVVIDKIIEQEKDIEYAIMKYLDTGS